MKKTPVDIKIGGSELFHSMPDILRQRGSVLINLIVIMIIFAILGSALVVMFSTSTLHHVNANQGMRAYYLAESGYRYAASEYLNGGTGEDRDDVLTVLNGNEFLFSGNNSAFGLEIESYFYKCTGLDDSTLKTEAFGNIPDKILTNEPEVSPGTLAVFNDSTFCYDFPDFTDYSIETGANGPEIHFTIMITEDTEGIQGTRVFPAVKGISDTQTIKKGSNVSFTGTGVLFPSHYGAFRIYNKNGNEKGDTIFSYEEIDTSTSNNQLTEIKDMMNPENSFSGVDFKDTDYIVLQRFINFTSTGRFGDLDSSFASKTLTYAVPLEAITAGGAGGTEEIGEDDELLEALAENDGSGASLAQFDVQLVGGDDALAVTKTTGGSGNQPRVEAIVGLPDGEDNPFYDAWSSSGHFLNYDAQVKVAAGTYDADGVFSDKPDYYMAGLSFRFGEDNAGKHRSYGLSFMRSTNDEEDGIPDYLVPGYVKNGPVSPNVDTPMVVLWDRGGRGNSGGDEWMAYMELPSDDPVLDQPSAGNDQGAWSSSTDYDVDDVVTHSGVEYICSADHTSTSGNNSNEPGVGKNWEDYWNVHGAIHLSDWATIMVRIVEAASIRYEGTTTITTGDTVTGGTSGAQGEVVKKIKTDTGEILLLNNLSGTFSLEPVADTSVTITEWRERDNYIWAFYGNQDDEGTANDTPLDYANRLGNTRSGDIHWSVDNVNDWAADSDYFTLVQWNETLNTDSYFYSDMVRLGKGKELNAIIRTNLYLTPDDVYDYPSELGVHALGASASLTYFDDFGAIIRGKGEERPVGFLSGSIVQQE